VKRCGGAKCMFVQVPGERKITRIFTVGCMFLGGSCHDRDNPHMWGVSHGKRTILMTLECSQKDSRHESSRPAVEDFELQWMIV
jgi:hypothetical protein